MVNNSTKSNFHLVGEFHEAFGVENKDEPDFPEDKTCKLRVGLISEELEELEDAIRNEDIVAVADALTDLLYVVYGSGHAFGIDLDRCFREVHRSNMSKLGADGKPVRREDGKVLKGPSYTPPDLSFLLQTNFMVPDVD
jgi:predicted HAD superfamily Cof-like phosphohydrolase